MEFCQICLEEVKIELIFQISCGCRACIDCHRNWVDSQLSDMKTYLRCPLFKCGLMLDSLEDLLLPSQIAALRENQLRMYLTFSKGIRWCPNKSCGYAGFTSKSSQQDFFCEKCQECWLESSELFKGKLDEMRYFIEEGLNIGWKALFCKMCSGCEVFIEKNQGCRHIDCIMCGTDFCWFCKQSYKTHKQDQCSNKYGETTYKVLVLLCIVLFTLKACCLFENVFFVVYLALGVPLWCVYILMFKIFVCVILAGLGQMILNFVVFLVSKQMWAGVLGAVGYVLGLVFSNFIMFVIPFTLLLFTFIVHRAMNYYFK